MITFQAANGHTIEVIASGHVQHRLSIEVAQDALHTLTKALTDAQRLKEEALEANREKFSLELGVDLVSRRVCALEAGPFDTSEDAVKFAFAVRGRTAEAVATLPESEWFDLLAGDADDLPIVGATLNIFTDADGTVRDVILY